MDKGLKDLIEELREYAAPRKGELAGMLMEAANRLEECGGKLEKIDRLCRMYDHFIEVDDIRRVIHAE